MKKQKTDRVSKEFYATSGFIRNFEDPYTFLQLEKQRREKSKVIGKKEIGPINVTPIAQKDDKKGKTKLVKKYM